MLRENYVPFVPFCWWVAVVVDHYSRRVISVGVFDVPPDCRAICSFLGRAIGRTGNAPKYLVCDRDSIFDCQAFRRWVKQKGIKPPRYGAVGKHGGIAVVERFILTMKNEATRRILVPQRRDAFRSELIAFVDWFNEHRPHVALGGQAPNEVYFGRQPANRRPRIEPRKQRPRRSPCAKPQTLVAGQPGDRFVAGLSFHTGRRHLPVVTLQRAA